MSESVKKRRTRKSTSTKDNAESYIADKYYSDCFAEGMLYGVIVRSPYAYGKIMNIIIDLPEGYSLFTAHDIPGKNEIRTFNTSTKIFCTDEVSYIGEPIGIIVGPELKTARKLAAEIRITFDISTIKSAVRELNKNYNRPFIKLSGDLQNEGKANLKFNVRISQTKAEKISIEENLSDINSIRNTILYEKPIAYHSQSHVIAERIVRTGIFQTSKQTLSALKKSEEFYSQSDFEVSTDSSMQEFDFEWTETSGAFCFTKGQKLTVMTTTQWPEHLRSSIAGVLNIDEERIIVKKTLSQPPVMSGLWRCTMIAAQAALASYLCGKPVKLILSQKEQSDFMPKGLRSTISYKSAVDKDGKINALRVNIDADSGCKNPFAEDIANRLAVAAISFYNIENIYICARIHTSNMPPSSIYPELVDSQVFFALENHIQRIAERTGLLPDEIRQINIIKTESEQKSPFEFKFPKAEVAIQAIMAQSSFKRKYSSLSLLETSSKNADDKNSAFKNLPRRGIGLSCAYTGSCFFGSMFNSYDRTLEVTLLSDGTLLIHTMAPSTSVGLVWKKIASELLEIPVESIKITDDTGSQMEAGIPENFYNNVSILTMLIKRCCTEIQKKRFHSPLPITAKKAVTPAMKKQWNRETFSGSPFHTTAFGTAILELELDAATYEETVKGIWIALDCGEIFSVKAAENEVRLAVRQELERLMENETVECKSISISFIQSNNPPCRIDRIVHNLIPAAFTNAMSQALGKPLTKLPCSKETFFNLLNEHKTAADAQTTSAKAEDLQAQAKTERV